MNILVPLFSVCGLFASTRRCFLAVRWIYQPPPPSYPFFFLFFFFPTSLPHFVFAQNETAAAERAAAVQSKLKESGGGPRNSAMGVPLVQSDGRRSSDPNLVIDLDEKAKLTDHPFKRPEKPMIDVAPGSPKRGRASVAEREAAKREIEMGLEMGRLRLEEDNTGMVFCVQMDTNQRRYDLDPMQHGICLPDANDVFEDGFKTIKRGATARDLVKDHATKQKREMRRQNSVYALHFHHCVCV